MAPPGTNLDLPLIVNASEVNGMHSANDACPAEESEFIGMPIDSVKEDKVFRVHGCNPNGLQVATTDNTLSEYIDYLKSLHVDLACFYELNLDTRQYWVQKRIYDTCQSPRTCIVYIGYFH